MTRPKERDDEMLTPREARWVAEYLASSSKKRASEAAGYAQSVDLLKRPTVAMAVGKRIEDIMGRKAVTADRVVEELGKIAFANMDDYVEDDWAVKAKPRRRKMAAVKSVKVKSDVIRDKSGDPVGEVEEVTLQMHDKLGALNSLARKFGLFIDKVEISGDLTERMNRAYERIENQE